MADLTLTYSMKQITPRGREGVRRLYRSLRNHGMTREVAKRLATMAAFGAEMEHANLNIAAQFVAEINQSILNTMQRNRP